MVCLVTLLAGLIAAVGWAEGPQIAGARLGIADVYKVGNWIPLRVELAGGDDAAAVSLVALAPDYDGRLVQYSTPPSKPIAVLPGDTAEVELLVRVGSSDPGLMVRAIVGGRVVDTKRVSTGQGEPRLAIRGAAPSGARLVLQVGSGSLGVRESLRNQAEHATIPTVTVAADQWRDLPLDYLGYESFDTVLLAAGTVEGLANLSATDARLTALTEWVEQGGRLVVVCGEAAGELLVAGGPLAGLVPGTCSGTSTLTDPRAIESFAGSEASIGSIGQISLTIARLDQVTGDTPLLAKIDEESVPLLVRKRLGFGQVTLLALDLQTPLLANWSGRDRLVAKVLEGSFPLDEIGSQEDGYWEQPDATHSIWSRLDEGLEASGVSTPPFVAVAGLVVLYIALIGPFDYWLTTHVLKRREATWITFPAIVLLSCLGAYFLANAIKGRDLVVGHVELIDHDLTGGATRGTLWTHVFSPVADRYELTTAPRQPAGVPAEVVRNDLSWFGADQLVDAGGGLGSLTGIAEYQSTPDRTKLAGMPIQVWSTQSTVTRWQGTGEPFFAAELRRDANSRVDGAITNRTQEMLSRCRLVYGPWVCRLGNIGPAQTIRVEGNLATSSVLNVLQNDHSVVFGTANGYEKTQLAARLPLRGVLDVVMFHQSLGGGKGVYFVNREAPWLDCSPSLDQRTAVLVAEVNQPTSELRNGDQPLRGRSDSNLLVWRVWLPVDIAN